MKFCVVKEFVSVALRMCFQAIQRSDCKIDDHFKTELDDEPERQFAENRFNQVKTKSVHDGLSSEGKCRSQCLTSRSDWHCSAV